MQDILVPRFAARTEMSPASHAGREFEFMSPVRAELARCHKLSHPRQEEFGLRKRIVCS